MLRIENIFFSKFVILSVDKSCFFKFW